MTETSNDMKTSSSEEIILKDNEENEQFRKWMKWQWRMY